MAAYIHKGSPDLSCQYSWWQNQHSMWLRGLWKYEGWYHTQEVWSSHPVKETNLCVCLLRGEALGMHLLHVSTEFPELVMWYIRSSMPLGIIFFGYPSFTIISLQVYALAYVHLLKWFWKSTRSFGQDININYVFPFPCWPLEIS